MAELTAIDILFNPDDATVERARSINARVRRSAPGGFALDAEHRPHITVLQRFIRTQDLDHVYDAVEKTMAVADLPSLSFQAVAISHVDWGVPGRALAVLVVRPSPQVLDFQAEMLAAIGPFVESGGTAAAFVTDADEPDISQITLDWVENFVPSQIGRGKYFAHITLGFATLDFLETLETEPFDTFAIHPTNIAVFHLGNNGTARTQLESWTLAA